MPGKKYPFIISNTDRSDEGGTQQWSILNISPKSELLKIDGKVLKGLELADQKENKLTLVQLKFSMNSYENLAENETKKLSETAQDLFHLIQFLKK